MPTKRRTMHGAGLLDALTSALKSSKFISELAGQVPIVGGIAKPLVGLTGYGKKKRAPKKRMHGAGILADLVGMVGLGRKRKHRGAGKAVLAC